MRLLTASTANSGLRSQAVHDLTLPVSFFPPDTAERQPLLADGAPAEFCDPTY
jgi:hypothetical protein